jgi:hypothetical protein
VIFTGGLPAVGWTGPMRFMPIRTIRITVFGLALAGALALSGCGGQKDGDGIATAGNTSEDKAAASTEVSTDLQEQMRQFAQCMRDQGIDMPDPEFVEGEGGGFSFRANPGGGTGQAGEVAPADENVLDREKFKAANEACKQFLPSGGELGRMDPEIEEKAREFAKCMRENGVENFPDPGEGGRITIRGGGGPGSENEEGGINFEDPAFAAAQEKCSVHMPQLKMAVPKS